MGRLEMFDDAPTVDSVHDSMELVARFGFTEASREFVQVVLDELAFTMKTVTRLGRAILFGQARAFFAHPSSPVADQLRRYLRVLIAADGSSGQDLAPEMDVEVDWSKVVELEQFGPLVAVRAGVPWDVSSLVVSAFFGQVETLLGEGEQLGTPRRWLDLEHHLEAELAGNLEVLGWHGYPALRLHGLHVPLGAVGTADLVCRTDDGGWLIIEVKQDRVDDRVVGQIAGFLDAVAGDLASPGDEVRGLVLGDGDSEVFVDALADEPRVSFLNLRALDLPVCRAQRFQIVTGGAVQGWVAVAADGRTLVGGGGPGLPSTAPALPFDELPVDWSTTKVWPLPVGDRSRPGER